MLGTQVCKTFPDCNFKSFACTVIPTLEQAESVELRLIFHFYKEQGSNLEIRLQTVDGQRRHVIMSWCQRPAPRGDNLNQVVPKCTRVPVQLNQKGSYYFGTFDSFEKLCFVEISCSN